MQSHITAQRQIIDIFLHPGEHYFGDEDTRIRTILGSCVAVTLWHPRERIGGMCHYLLPSRDGSEQRQLDGRYANEALDLLFIEMARYHLPPEEYEVKMFGGGNMFPNSLGADGGDVGTRNIEYGRRLLDRKGLRLKSQHVAGAGHRLIILELWSGSVWLRHCDLSPGQ